MQVVRVWRTRRWADGQRQFNVIILLMPFSLKCFPRVRSVFLPFVIMLLANQHSTATAWMKFAQYGAGNQQFYIINLYYVAVLIVHITGMSARRQYVRPPIPYRLLYVIHKQKRRQNKTGINISYVGVTNVPYSAEKFEGLSLMVLVKLCSVGRTTAYYDGLTALSLDVFS